jgi:S-adenosylmethionine hydrolase
MKGVILSMAPGTVLVDITHEIPARDVVAGALTLAQAAPFFPTGSIHVAVVDPGVGGSRADVIVEAAGCTFIGPDNGLLTLAARNRKRAFCIESPAFRREPVSPTFHGRDVLAPAAGCVARGLPACQAGPPLAGLTELPISSSGPLVGEGQGEVIHVDRFGNLITSFEGSQAPTGTWELEMEWNDRRLAVLAGRTYSDVTPGGLVLYPGSSGQIELAVRDGSAAEETGARRGTRVRLRRIA